MSEVKLPNVEVMCMGDVLWVVSVDGKQVYEHLMGPATKGRTYQDLIGIALGVAFLAGRQRSHASDCSQNEIPHVE